MLQTLRTCCGPVAALSRIGACLAVALLVATAVAPSSAGADARAERERVRSQKAERAAEVDALKADQAAVNSALADLDRNLQGQQAAYADAERSLSQAEDDVQRFEAAAEAKGAEVAGLKDRIAELAVEAYVNPPSSDLFTAFGADSASDAVRRRSLLDLRAGRDLDLLDELRAAEAELESLRDEAGDAAAAARERRSSVAQRLEELNSARAQQSAFVQEIDRRLDAKLSEAAALAAVDSQLSQQIAAQEAELAASVRRSSGYSGGGSFRPPPTGSVAVTHVGGGIYVANAVASQTRAMIDAAAAAGISLSGHSFRDPNEQIALRRQNCGSSDYAIWQMPASQCSPATARPGFSKHEQGLAIDFSGMRYGSAGYNWLRANAGTYGYASTVPGEPWHWSVGGG